MATVADAVRPRVATGGDVICRQGDTGYTMYVVVRGRVKLAVDSRGEPYRLLGYIGRGQHFGEMAVLTDGLRTATASAVIDTELLELDRDCFERLLDSVPKFAANLSRSLGFRLRWDSRSRKRNQELTLVGIVNSTLRTQGLIGPLARALRGRGESVEVLTDRPDKWPAEGNYLIERIPAGLTGQDKVRAVRERLHQVVEHHTRVLLDLTQVGLENELPQMLSMCEEIWWLVETRYADTSWQNLRKLLAAEPRLAGRPRIIWIMGPEERFRAACERCPGRAARFQSRAGRTAPGQQPTARARNRPPGASSAGSTHRPGTRRWRCAGTGASGRLAAIGKSGLSFDMLAGTSSGALMGAAYAGGFSPQEAVEAFREALTPPRLAQAMPGGNRIYIWTMFRIGAWDRMLRHSSATPRSSNCSCRWPRWPSTW